MMTKTEIDVEVLARELETHLQNQTGVSDLIQRVEVSPYEDLYDDEVRCLVTIILKHPSKTPGSMMNYVGEKTPAIDHAIYSYFKGKQYYYRTIYGFDPKMNTVFESWEKLCKNNPGELSTFISLLLLNRITYYK